MRCGDELPVNSDAKTQWRLETTIIDSLKNNLKSFDEQVVIQKKQKQTNKQTKHHTIGIFPVLQ